MEILNKDRYDEFDKFCENHPHGAFQQSPRWALVKTEWESEIVVSRNADGEIIGGVFVLIRKMGLKTMMYACRGPVCDYTDKAVIRDLLDGVKVLAKKYKAYQFIMDPLVMADDAETIDMFRSCGLELEEHAPFHDTIQPRYNYMLRYLKGINEDELMKKMSRDTRYYLRYPEKKGVVCKNLGLDGLEDFYRIYSETGVRQKFAVRPKEYFVKMLTGLGENCRLYMCYSPDGEALCGGVAVQYAGTTSHVYGCSNDIMRNLRPTYLLQKYLMLWALEGGCHTYDMQGVAPTPEDSEALYRILDFKSNFTGEVVETAGEFKITFDPLYANAFETALKIRTKIKKHK